MDFDPNNMARGSKFDFAVLLLTRYSFLKSQDEKSIELESSVISTLLHFKNSDNNLYLSLLVIKFGRASLQNVNIFVLHPEVGYV